MYSTNHFPGANGSTIARIGRLALALTVACALTFGSGCALLSDNLEKAAKGAGKVVTAYCENVTVPEVRAEIAKAVNDKAAPHKVEVTCADEIAAPGPTAWNWLDWLTWFDSKPIVIIERQPIVVIENA